MLALQDDEECVLYLSSEPGKKWAGCVAHNGRQYASYLLTHPGRITLEIKARERSPCTISLYAIYAVILSLTEIHDGACQVPRSLGCLWGYIRCRIMK